MNHEDELIRGSYDRLGTALLPPEDAAERVARRVTARRRRRTALAGTAAAVTAGVVGTAAVWAAGGPGGDGSTVTVEDTPAGFAPAGPSGPTSTLALTRPDGSTVAFDDVTVSCEAPFGEENAQGEAAGRIWLTSPLRVEGADNPADDDAEAVTTFVYFEGVVDKLRDEDGTGRTFRLPVDGDSAKVPFVLFVNDPESGKGGNEVSSNQPEATGTVRVLEVGCDPVPVLALEVDATLGSEEDKGTLDLAGEVR